MVRYAAVMSTNSWDPFVESQFHRTAANVKAGDAFILADETAGPLAVPPRYPCVVADEASVRRLGLPTHYERTLFCYNVDYLYYSFFLRHPGYDYYVFFDYPAVADLDLDAVIAAVDRDGIDLAAEPVAGAMNDWVYAERHAALYPPGVLRGVALPLAILSKAALAFLLQRRLELAHAFAKGSVSWPFCEAFVPSELVRAGFRVAPLSAFGSTAAFAWWPPVLDSALPAEREPGFIHPLLDRPRYLGFMLAHAPTRDLPKAVREVLRRVPLRDCARPLLAQIGAKLTATVRNRLPRRRSSASPLQSQS